MKNDIYKPVLFQTTMRKHNRAEGGVVGMGQKDLRLNRTACLMQRLMLAAFFALAVSALAVGISQGERYLQAFTLALLGLSLYTALCVPAAKRLEHLGPLRLWLLLTILCTAIKVFWIWRVRVPLAGDYSGLLGICQCACGAHNGIRRAVYGPVSPYFRICRFSELVYSPVGATAHACSGAQCTADGLLRQFFVSSVPALVPLAGRYAGLSALDSVSISDHL